jgi:membrane protein YdbS with pleckstrin-like domain
MNGHVERATAWLYRGIWGVLSRWFRVPQQPPTLPAARGETVQSFRPANGFLRYLKLKFWLALTFFDVTILVLWVALLAAFPRVALWLAPVVLVVAVVPDILAYIAIHLRYDTTWYVLSRRSLRIRGGIWVIHEATITFENIQNVTVQSGPIERWFGISNVIVDTAGGGQLSKESEAKGKTNLHRGVISGISNAAEIRQLILSRLLHAKTAGLGDDQPDSTGWTAEHVGVLREIRDALVRRG